MSNIVLGALLLSGTPSYRQAGVHYYARNLLAALARLAPHAASTYTALVSPTALDETRALAGPNFAVRSVSRTTEKPFSRIRVEQIETPPLLHQLRADLYHGLGFVAPSRSPCPTVVSVMDLSFITQPQAHKLFNRTYLRWFTRASCRRARRVIAISEWTKRDIVEHFGIAPERVDAIPLGVDLDRFRPQPPDALAAFRTKHNIGPRTIFYLGSLEPRKNLPRLIEAFAHISGQWSEASNRADATPHMPQLFIGGNLAWKYDEIFARIKVLGLSAQVQLIGRVSDDDLPLWYSACAVTAYPSLYEGFGLPPLEAMACGAPVVTSNVTSLPEVVGDAGLTVMPTDTDALADALQRVLSDNALRADMAAKSIRRAQQFTWQHTAERTVESYARAIDL